MSEPPLTPIPGPIRAALIELVRRLGAAPDGRPDGELVPEAVIPGRVISLWSGGRFGWRLDARLDEVDGRLALEVLEDSRMAGPSHYRLWEDASTEPLPTPHSAYVTSPTASDEERRAAEQAFFAHNARVARLLAERGFPAEPSTS